jgi:protein-disulfide isomerase
VSLVFFQAQATTTKRSAAMDRLFYLAMMGLMMTLFTGCTMAGRPSSPTTVAIDNQAIATTATVPVPAVPTQSSNSQTTTTAASATEPTNWLATVTVDGTSYILGNPKAPIRLVEYSDFL